MKKNLVFKAINLIVGTLIYYRIKELGLLIIVIHLLLASCTNGLQYDGLRKLTADELIERAHNNNWPDVMKVIYVNQQGDTISIDSVQKMNYHKIFFDDYVDSTGIVVLSVVRPATKSDLALRKKMTSVSEEHNLDGQLSTIELYSDSLAQNRMITTYVPNTHTTDIYFYLTDGSVVKDLASKVNELIVAQQIVPIKLIGINSDIENRHAEYIYSKNPDELFYSHLYFFSEEVPKVVERNSDISSTKRYLFGFSNGADFCNYMGVHKPEWVHAVLSMSGVAYFPIDLVQHKIHGKAYPNFILSSGIEENLFHKNSYLKKQLEELGAEVIYEEHNGGHEYVIWKQRFIDYIKKEFSTSK